MSGRITPVVLTRDEEPNIARCLESLSWATKVLVVDSGSRDRTEQVARSFPNVVWCTRAFDRHGKQWEHGIQHPEIDSEYVLALDADMAVPPAAQRELEAVAAEARWDGGILGFDYCYDGRRLLGSVYPPQLRLFRRSVVSVTQPGHTQVFTVPGPVKRLRGHLIHDDRKPLPRWLQSQAGYARLEAARLTQGAGGVKSLVRRAGLGPALVGVSAWLRAGGPLGGQGALRYACERTLFECLLRIALAREGEFTPGASP